jgi:cell volume regulation protein A
LAFVGLLVFLAHLFVVLFRKTRVPDVLLLIFIGLILGPGLGIVHPEHFGKVGPVFAQIALALILFEGGHESRWDVLRENWKGCLALIFPAFLGAFLLGAGLMKFYFGLNNESACLFGAILGSASPSVVVPLVKQLRMHRGPALVLTLESALADVLCLVLVLGFLEAHESGGVRISGIVIHILSSFFVAGLIGAVAGLGWSLILARIRSIENNIFLTLALVFVLFGALDAMHLSGGVAVLLFGMAIANAGSPPIPWLRRFGAMEPVQFTGREKAFFSEMVFLIKTFFFVYLGLSLHLKDWKALAIALGLVAAINVIRLPFVRVAMNTGTTRRDAALMTIMSPKGLAAAVLASLPFQQGWEHGELIRDISYGVILFSIVGTSVMVFLLEKTALSGILQSFFPRPSVLPSDAKPAPES